MKKLMLGNEAVARGLYEAGCSFVSSYPGTPSTEITEAVARFEEIYAEWAPNEKVAMESAFGACVAGKRSFCGMKHVGLNVAADPLFTISYTGVNAGMIIGVADDAGMHSSQNEQDSRHYARASKIPMLEPSDSAEALAFTKLAYELSEQFDTPVFIKMCTRVAHSQSIVEPGEREEHSKAYERFKDKMLSFVDMGGTWVVDPRYPEVREYLIDIYRRALTDWGLDGLKLDFIDSFRQSDEVKEGMDYVSVYDAVDRLMKDVIAALREIKPDVLIEFRQSYMGPLMRTFGNMIRSGDCPRDSLRNRQNVLALRMTSGNTAVHSDMTMWHGEESAEEAAFQLTNVLFSVPQISVRCRDIPEDHAEMIKNYLAFWTKYRDVLLDGKMLYKNYVSNYTYVSSLLGNVQVGAVYSGRIAYLETPTDEIALVNASGDREVLAYANFGGTYRCTVTDCMGHETFTGEIEFGALARIPMPVNGYAYLTKIS